MTRETAIQIAIEVMENYPNDQEVNDACEVLQNILDSIRKSKRRRKRKKIISTKWMFNS